MLAIGLPNLATFVLVLLAACLTKGDGVRRTSGIVLGLCALAPAWWVPIEHPLLRAASALIAIIGAMRVIDLYRGEWPLASRIAHVLSLVDTRRLVRSQFRLDLDSLRVGVLWFGAALIGYDVLVAPLHLVGAAFWFHRWGCTLVLAYAAVSAGYALDRTAYTAIGFETGPLHRAPLMSRSVQELWGERWARPISVWLRETFFRPCARRRHPLRGALLAFGISGVFHAYGVWVALGVARGIPMAMCMLVFFVLQGGIVGLERWLGVRGWTSWSGHVWTVSWMLVTAPFFLEPAVRIVGVTAP